MTRVRPTAIAATEFPDLACVRGRLTHPIAEGWVSILTDDGRTIHMEAHWWETYADAE